MNQRARDILTTAALNGTPQVFDSYVERLRDRIGYCAVGLLRHKAFNRVPRDLTGEEEQALGLDQPHQLLCPACPAHYYPPSLLIHLNDVHRWDFLTIARKFPEIEETAP